MRLVLPLLLGATLVAALPVSVTGADRPEAGRPEAIRQAVTRSMSLLEKAQPVFERKATCASCHSQVQPLIAAQAAHAKGLPVDMAVAKRQEAAILGVLTQRHDYSLAHGVGGGGHAVTGPIMAGLIAARTPADENTDAAVVYLMGKQNPAGNWQTVAVRSPSGETDFQVTAAAVRAIDAYAPPSLRHEADAHIARARAWLVATPAPMDNDALVNRLAGLVYAKAPARDVANARARLGGLQQADGGWSQRPGMASDAYATADTMVALYAGGMKPTDPVYRKAVDYLLRTQAADGSWYVKSRALPIQPPIDSGFPYGPDQWISAWSTALAATALAYTL